MKIAYKQFAQCFKIIQNHPEIEAIAGNQPSELLGHPVIGELYEVLRTKDQPPVDEADAMEVLEVAFSFFTYLLKNQKRLENLNPSS